ncbi:CRISPR-associated endonuclease Cas3'' [Thermus filiformis]|uniref:CRISPR-associated protein Cas3 n=1 Tax=Thermus filiformis TaxID=276 RepID=A0A0A2WQY1_THEFI|nr:CRISPR-associated endonuclease Cas3'' [Thermus filiformis]KGQ22203.1 CRISPR-associated protein Cas3 [Thermus filiformis]
MVEKAALTLWAKSDPYRSLLAHMLDTAAVALALLEREPERTRRLYAEDWKDWGLDEEEALRFVAFLVGLHDLGKAVPVFQGAWLEGAERVRSVGLTWEGLKDKEDWVAHGVFTELLVQEALRAKGLPRRAARHLAQGLGAHHGFPAEEEEKRRAGNQLGLEAPLWKEARAFLVEALWEALGRPFSRGGAAPGDKEVPPQAVLRVMALASFADWIASDPGFYAQLPDPPSLEEARREAHRALDALGWRVPRLPLKGFQELFPFKPNPLQEAVPELLQGVEEPVLLLVEAPMGTGKTEAALYAFLLLKEGLGHRGLYAALPTQATASGLFPRVRDFLERLKAGVLLDLQLQHGSALLNPQYQELREKARPGQVYEEGGPEEAGVAASAWFSARKRAMLSPHGVGTLDQALLGVLKVKHHFVRLWGLMNRVVILDEVHAYDTYTSSLLKALLLWLRALGSSVVLMTATLPPSKRKELLEAWGVEDVPDTVWADNPYPRVAAFAGGRLLGARSLPKEIRRVRLERAPLDPSSLAGVLRQALPGCLGAVVNTVDRAQELYRALGEGEALTLEALLDHLGPGPDEGPWRALWEERERKGKAVVGKRLPDGTLVFLLHARFPAEERALREGVILSLFGKHGPRPEKAILVATQVVEQSLDLDFDLLYSDLAPVDLLFQRLGRLWRHPRGRKGYPRLLLGGLEGPESWKGLYWSLVYEEYVLLSTWLALKDREALNVPEDIEPLLEEVYERPPEAFPEELRKRAEESHRRLEGADSKDKKSAENLALSQLDRLLPGSGTADLVAESRVDDDEEKENTQLLLTRQGLPSVAVVPLYPGEEGYFLDPEGKQPARLKGDLSDEEVLALWSRAVRLSRRPIPETLLKEDPPPAWRKNGLLRGLRPLEVGRVFPRGRGGLRVELDPELGVVYREG